VGTQFGFLLFHNFVSMDVVVKRFGTKRGFSELGNWSVIFFCFVPSCLRHWARNFPRARTWVHKWDILTSNALDLLSMSARQVLGRLSALQ
jgi:hypothetical protein